MSKAKFDAAKELITEKKYAEARRLLATLDHPTARDWEARLDKLDPPIASFPAAAPPKSQPSGCSRRSLLTVGVLVLAVVVVAWSQNQRATPSVALQVSDTPALTDTPGPSPTSTLTETPTPTPLPSDTPLPSATPTPDFGSRSAPYPLGQIGAIRDGQFRVNSLQRNATAAIKAMNMFNEDPAADEDWVIVNVTFQCGLPADQTCHTSLMRLEMVGDLGSVYDWDFAVLDDRFEGDVLGGGQRSGNLAFLVKQGDTRLMVAVNDLGDRVFFSAE